jgi:hypothetical protein
MSYPLANDDVVCTHVTFTEVDVRIVHAPRAAATPVGAASVPVEMLPLDELVVDIDANARSLKDNVIRQETVIAA